ncbi:MAG: serine/threonine protein kinase [Myxococcales bacterium]|nr:serine/threonine protein kinase [Myxococcales bacterium]
MSRRPQLDETPTRDIGPYRIVDRIAVGGMAEVYRALWPQAAGGDRSVVIKRLLPETVDDADRLAMFEDEVRLGSRIDHPNVVAVLDHGVDDGAPYMVLEYVFGVDLWRLTRWLRASGRELDVATTVWIATQLLGGLEAVHALRDERGGKMRVTHRDVSPSNVFLSVHGDVKLGDLGIAQPTHGPSGGGAAARAKGKLGYLSPEQVDGRAIDPRADVFSAAVVLAELLTGRPLFSGGTEIAVLLAKWDGDVRVLRAFASRLPEGLADVVLGALERRPEQRTPSAAAFREQLAPFVTVPEARCRSELGALVVGALDDETSSAEQHALKKTVEQAGFGRGTPPEPDAPRYAVEREGRPVGEYDLAELVVAVTTGDVRPTDGVRWLDQAPRRVEQVPELAGFIPSSSRTKAARRLVELRETSERWDLASQSLVAVLGELLRAGETGLLLCEQRGIRKEVWVEEGEPAFVTSNQPDELFGEALVRSGVIARDELDLALAALPRYRGQLGETLVGMGLLHPVDLVHHLSEHVRQRLLSIFEWREGVASLYRQIERPARAFRIDMDPWTVLEEGMERRLAGGEPLGHPDATVRAVAAGYALPPPLFSLAARCAQPTPLGALADGAEPARMRARVAVLLELGVLRWHDSSAEA